MIRAGLLLAMLCLLAAACDSGGDGEAPPVRTVDATSQPTNSPSSTPRARPTAVPTSVSTLKWRDCDEGYECATLDVPLDYDDPGVEGIDLEIVRLPAADPSAYIGPLFVNPGGPGSSSIAFVRDAPFIFPREIIDRFDIIGVDTRGIGESFGIDCRNESDTSRLDFTPEDDDEIAGLEEYARTYASACAQRNRTLLPVMDTISAARDIERVREAIGAPQISFIGYSYGTVLGAAYADMFPDHVRAMVLDGALPAGLSFEQRVRDSAIAFERAMQAFLDDCASHRACDFYSDGDPHGAYDALLARLEDESIPALQYEDDVTTTADDVRAAVANSLYDRGSWIQLAFALVIADQDDDGTYILDLAYPSSGSDEDTNEYDANTAITCIDATWPGDTETYATLARELQREAPRVGAGGVFFDLPCAFWGAPSRPLPEFDASGAPPILVIGSTGDTATPYEWAVTLAEQLETATLLTYDGFTHTASFGGISPCVDEATLVYLTDLELPAEDRRTCD